MTAGIPTREELASDLLVHRPADLFNPPALTNFLGGVQAAGDPVALWNLNFPPFACGDIESGRLYLDGWVFGASGEPVTYRWLPDRIERSATWRGLEVTSTTVLAWGEMAAIVRFGVRNVTGETRRTRLGIGLLGSISRSDEQWNRAMPPTESGPNVLEDGMDHGREAGSAGTVVDRTLGAITFSAPSGSSSVQGVVPPSPDLDDRGAWYDLELAPGETWSGAYVHAIGEDAAAARATYARLAADVDGQIAETGRQWDAELAAVFTPGNDRYSGSLPVLESDDPDLRRLYHMGVLGVIYFKRDSPYSVVGRAYDTLLPRYWATTTFIWDFSLSSLVHALLDPVPMRGQLERWMALDVHACYGSDWLTGKALGAWYASNDHSLTQLIDTYLRWTGDTPWLDAELRLPDGASRVRDQLARFANGWQSLLGANGLADYGGVNNLLECVSSYVHEVAALNGANVWNLRTAAGHLRAADPAAADAMERDAGMLLERVMGLYADGEGWFNARMPDGRLLPRPPLLRPAGHARPARRRAGRSAARRDGPRVPGPAPDAELDARAVAGRPRRHLERAARPPVERRLHGVAFPRRDRPVRHRPRRHRRPVAPWPGEVRQPGPVRAGALRGRGGRQRVRWGPQGAVGLAVHQRLGLLVGRLVGTAGHPGPVRRPGVGRRAGGDAAPRGAGSRCAAREPSPSRRPVHRRPGRRQADRVTPSPQEGSTA